jgi:hypothetical protein
MKKLLFLVLYIFCSVAILPSGSLKNFKQQQEALSRRMLELQEVQKALCSQTIERLEEEAEQYKKAKELRELAQQAANIFRNSCGAVYSCIYQEGVPLEEVEQKLSEDRQRYAVIDDMFKKDGHALEILSHHFCAATVNRPKLPELDKSLELEQLKKEAELHRLAQQAEKIQNESFKATIACVAGKGICPKDLVVKTSKDRQKVMDIRKILQERGQELSFHVISAFWPPEIFIADACSSDLFLAAPLPSAASSVASSSADPLPSGASSASVISLSEALLLAAAPAAPAPASSSCVLA